MRKIHLSAIAVALVLVAGITAALASGYYPGLPAPTLPLTGNEYNAWDTGNGQGITPATEAITTGQLVGVVNPQSSPRNFLSNGQITVDQQGTGTITCGTTSITALEFAADRWFCDQNVGSGAQGRSAVITASPAPPTGFLNSVKLWRVSGTATQPVCLLQELTNTPSAQLAGKNVILSAYVQALAGLTSVNDQVQAYVIYGTGSEQGLGTLTASTAITPAWTNITGGTTAAATWATTTSWARYNTPVISIPAQVASANVTEVGVEICFTPVGTGSATDGFAITGIQLEIVNQSPTVAGSNGSPITATPSPFEFHTPQQDTLDAQRFFVQFTEANYPNGSAMPGFCQALTSNTNTCTLNLPTPMRGTTPTITIGTAGTFKVNIANTVTTFATPTAGVCSIVACTITGANTNTAGQAEQFTSGGGSGIWTVSSDVIM